MLTIRQNVIGKGIKFVAEFNDLREIYNYYSNRYYYNDLMKAFSHNYYEYYTSFGRWPRDSFGRLTYIPPIHCMVIENEDGIRYSKEYVVGMFKKFWRIDHPRNWYYYRTGHKYHPRGNYHRRVKTTQERRMALTILEEEGEPKWRASRNATHLPNLWDDVPHFDIDNRNWKRFRKTQYKIK